MTRRMDVDVMAADRERVFTSRRQTVRIGTGPFRNYDLRFPVQWQGEITAYGVGEIETVRSLLATVNSLGTAAAQRLGQDRGFERRSRFTGGSRPLETTDAAFEFPSPSPSRAPARPRHLPPSLLGSRTLG